MAVALEYFIVCLNERDAKQTDGVAETGDAFLFLACLPASYIPTTARLRPSFLKKHHMKVGLILELRPVLVYTLPRAVRKARPARPPQLGDLQAKTRGALFAKKD